MAYRVQISDYGGENRPAYKQVFPSLEQAREAVRQWFLQNLPCEYVMVRVVKL